MPVVVGEAVRAVGEPLAGELRTVVVGEPGATRELIHHPLDLRMLRPPGPEQRRLAAGVLSADAETADGTAVGLRYSDHHGAHAASL